MKTENPANEKEITKISNELKSLRKSLENHQIRTIHLIRENDKLAFFTPLHFQERKEWAEKVEKEITDMENKIKKLKKELKDDFEEMDKIIKEKENGVWQSPIGGLEL